MVSKPRYGWWGYAKWMVRSYKGGTLMTREEIDAVDAAVEETKQLSDGAERLKLIDLVLWKRTHTLQGAAMYGNRAKQSELVGQREAIDCYDLIKSGFANTVDDASVIYWTISNAGGMDEIDMARFKESMRRIGVGLVDDDGAKAEAHTLTIPVEAREALLSRISDDLYRDFQMLDVTKLQGGQKTATEINAAYQSMDNKVDQFEYCVIDFLQALFKIVGIEDEPSFTRSKVTNQLEQTQMVLLAANYLDDETILNKLPWLTQEEVAGILKRKAAEDIERSFDPPEMVNDET